MQVPPPCCRGCNKRISIEYAKYWSIKQRNDPDRLTVWMARLAERPSLLDEYRDNEDEISDIWRADWSAWRDAARKTLDRAVPDDEFLDRVTPPELMRALGLVRLCCKNTVTHPPIVPVYHHERPPSSKLVVDDGSVTRFLSRPYGKSNYINANYTPQHETILNKLFPTNVARLGAVHAARESLDDTLQSLECDIDDLDV